MPASTTFYLVRHAAHDLLGHVLAGPLLGPCGYFMKSPPEQYTDDEARRRTLDFIAGEGGGPRVRARVRLAS